MREKETIERAARDKREGRAPTTQAGEFIREEMHHIRQGKHGDSVGQAGDRDRFVESARRVLNCRRRGKIKHPRRRERVPSAPTSVATALRHAAHLQSNARANQQGAET